MDAAMRPVVDAGRSSRQPLVAGRAREKSAARARVATVHCVGTSYVGPGHGPGVFAHRRGHLLLTDNSIKDYCHMSTVNSQSDNS